MIQRWYVVQTSSGRERRVRRDLLRRVESLGMSDSILEAVVPVESETEIRGGQRLTVQRRSFPGYVFVKMREISDDDPISHHAWLVVRDTPGVIAMVGADDRPVPLLDHEADRIFMPAVEPAKVKPAFIRGQDVRIIDGPFAEMRGIVNEINAERDKVKVLVEFFGRETSVELDFLQVQREEQIA